MQRWLGSLKVKTRHLRHWSRRIDHLSSCWKHRSTAPGHPKWNSKGSLSTYVSNNLWNIQRWFRNCSQAHSRHRFGPFVSPSCSWRMTRWSFLAKGSASRMPERKILIYSISKALLCTVCSVMEYSQWLGLLDYFINNPTKPALFTPIRLCSPMLQGHHTLS